MPCLKLLTNLPKSRIPVDLVDKIIPTLSKAVGKPPEKFLCVVQSDCQVACRGDSKAPAVVASLESIGKLGPQENNLIAGEVTKCIEKELNVDPNRIFLTFYDLQDINVAVGGTTVQDAMNKIYSS